MRYRPGIANAVTQHLATLLNLMALDRPSAETTLVQEEAGKLLANALMHQREKLSPALEAAPVGEKAIERLKVRVVCVCDRFTCCVCVCLWSGVSGVSGVSCVVCRVVLSV